jgi:hypothetical protein
MSDERFIGRGHEFGRAVNQACAAQLILALGGGLR